MIIKEADDKNPQVEDLQALAARPDCSVDTRERIELKIRKIKAGVRGEEEAAYEIKVHYGESRDWAVIHDLRIEHGGLTAQIDHLLVNRFMEIWVCESKRFSEGVSINEHGEFTAFSGGKPSGVPSPIEQNAKHILILKKLLTSGTISLPKRFFVTIKPDLKSLVLVSKNARISRPEGKIDGIEAIIKNDQIFKHINKRSKPSLLMTKIIGRGTLEKLARQIASQHKPIQFNWAAKFGLAAAAPAPVKVVPQVAQPASEAPVQTPMSEVTKATPAEDLTPRQQFACHSCGKSVTYKVAKFCSFNKLKFGGNVFCIECQRRV